MKKRRVAGSPIGRGGPSFEAMQLLDSSDLGLRSARLTFRSSNSPVTITLFPMVHLGGASFYDAVHKDAGAHDAMLLEGIRSPVAARITRAYRWIEGAKRIGLVVQPRPSAQSLAPAAVIHADLPKDEFERHWRKVPLYLRLVLYAGAPLYALHCRWFGSRAKLAKALALDDLPSRAETLGWQPEYQTIDEAIITARDQRLVAAMGDYLDMAPAGPRRLAIVYGAQHMRAVVKELVSKRNYRCVKSEWMLIFPLV